MIQLCFILHLMKVSEKELVLKHEKYMLCVRVCVCVCVCVRVQAEFSRVLSTSSVLLIQILANSLYFS